MKSANDCFDIKTSNNDKINVGNQMNGSHLYDAKGNKGKVIKHQKSNASRFGDDK